MALTHIGWRHSEVQCLAVCAKPELARLDRAVVEGDEPVLGRDGGGGVKRN